MFTKSRRALALLLFVAGALTLTASQLPALRSALSAGPANFTLHSRRVYRRDGGDWVEKGTTVRYAWGDGTWREVSQPGGRETFQIPGEGVYSRWPQQKNTLYLSGAAPGAARVTMADLRSDLNFVREESLLSERVAVIRHPTPNGYIELHRAPGLQGAVMKTVIVSPGLEEVSEPVAIERGTPATSERPMRPDPKSVRQNPRRP